MKKAGGIRVAEILVLLGISLAIVIPMWERAIERKRASTTHQVGETVGLMEEDETARQAEQAAERPTLPQIIKVGMFIVMAILVPTLLAREWLRQRKRRKR